MSGPDPLTRALLPALLHKLGNATQLLTGLNAMLSIEGGDALFAERAGDLADCSARVSDLGWALAALGSASGANLMLTRRDPRGLEILCTLVAESTRRSEGARVSVPPKLPQVAPSALNGWEVPWGIASLLWTASEHGTGTVNWSLSEQSGAWRLDLGGAGALDEAGQRIAPRLPGSEWTHAGDRGALLLPGAWLAPHPSAD